MIITTCHYNNNPEKNYLCNSRGASRKDMYGYKVVAINNIYIERERGREKEYSFLLVVKKSLNDLQGQRLCQALSGSSHPAFSFTVHSSSTMGCGASNGLMADVLTARKEAETAREEAEAAKKRLAMLEKEYSAFRV